MIPVNPHKRKKYSYYRNLVIVLFTVLLLPFVTAAQQRAALQMQEHLQQAIEQARPACVRMWGFDTVQNQRTSAQFSGLVVKGGYILTAAHVVVPGNTYRVMFLGHRNCIAVALGKIELAEDKTRPDVAVMQIVTKGTWPYAQLGSSDNLQTGEPCISIAYPESLNQEQPIVRFGQVSEPLNERGFIKSSCKMEPGDSGGPLFDIQGRIIGIHSAIEVAEEDNYDVPVNLYQKYWTALQTAVVYHTMPREDEYIKDSSLQNKPDFKLKQAVNHSSLPNYNRNSCIVIYSKEGNHVQKVLGTVISLRHTMMEKSLGKYVIISKSSMVADTAIFITAGAKKVQAKVLFKNKADDLVLLSTKTDLSFGIALKQLQDNVLENMRPGAILITSQVDTEAVTSILGSGPVDLPKITSAGFLGATAAHGSKTARIFFVRPGSPAAIADIKVNDVVTELDGLPIDSAGTFSAALSNYWPGDTIKLSIKRQDAQIDKTVRLTYPPEIKSNHPVEYFAGGKSLRRDGFSNVYINDATIKPEQCGAPVFNLKGEFCGIQIARFSRANSVILGTFHMMSILNQANGKFSHIKD